MTPVMKRIGWDRWSIAPPVDVVAGPAEPDEDAVTDAPPLGAVTVGEVAELEVAEVTELEVAEVTELEVAEVTELEVAEAPLLCMASSREISAC
jgi:hypothetical protein